MRIIHFEDAQYLISKIFTVLTETSYTRAVDWWGLGVLIFEMLVGEVFISLNNVDIFQ